MDYICYISRKKIDDLHSQLDPNLGGEMSLQITNERSRGANAGGAAPLAKLFSAGISYGRNDTIQINQTVKTAYVQKLRDVLLALYVDQGDIPDLASNSEPGFYFYSGKFHARRPKNPGDVSEVVHLTSTSPDSSYSLTLDCSLRHFSESDEGQSPIHSGNARFFDGIIDLRLEGVLILLARQNNRLVGSPLYLMLNIPNGGRAHLAL